MPAVGHDSFAESTFCSKEVAKGLNDIITYGGADQLLPCCLLTLLQVIGGLLCTATVLLLLNKCWGT